MCHTPHAEQRSPTRGAPQLTHSLPLLSSVAVAALRSRFCTSSAALVASRKKSGALYWSASALVTALRSPPRTAHPTKHLAQELFARRDVALGSQAPLAAFSDGEIASLRQGKGWAVACQAISIARLPTTRHAGRVGLV